MAFVGRSNVGKSSLLNRLLKKKVARVGKTPGKTRGVYFYESDEGHLLADLPGSGFARASRSERESWARLAEELFGSGRVSLAIRLLDPRVPDSALDRQIGEYLDAHGVPSLAVATKWDRLTAAGQSAARRRLEALHGRVIAVSARTGQGIEILRREIEDRIHSHEDANG